jgi:hypothetical protein
VYTCSCNLSTSFLLFQVSFHRHRRSSVWRRICWTMCGWWVNRIRQMQWYLIYSAFISNHLFSMQTLCSTAYFSHGSTALVVLGILIVEVSGSHADIPHSVGLLWRVIGLSHRCLPDNTTQHSQETDNHAPCGIRTPNPSKQAAADPRHHRPRGHWDLPTACKNT